jgi:FlaA1/EpsC-like NDP-sugar epimerase
MINTLKKEIEMLNRRNFLKNAGAATLAAGPFLKSTSRAASPNDTINIAVIGIRSRGVAHYKQFAKIPNVNIVTLCDVDERLFAKALTDLGSEKKVKTETDLRRVLNDKSVDAVSIATPDHWHALATIWACQAGKDVYVEKPASHTIWEGRKMVEAARKYNARSLLQAARHHRQEGRQPMPARRELRPLAWPSQTASLQ